MMSGTTSELASRSLAGGHYGTEPSTSTQVDSVRDEQLEFCDQHANERRQLYCLECGKMICALCYIADHSKHRFKKADEIRPQMEDASERIDKVINKCKTLRLRVDNDLADFKERSTNLEQVINEAAEDLKRAIDRDRDRLLADLQVAVQGQETQAKALQGEIVKRRRQMGQTKENINNLVSKYGLEYVAQEMMSLEDSVHELVNLDVLQTSVIDLASNSTDFRRTAYSESANVIGALVSRVHTATGHKCIKSGRLRHIVAKGAPVGGVTSLGDRFYVVRCRSDERIDAYDADTFAALTPLVVPGLSELPWGLAACSVNKCLYVSDDCNAVHRLDLSEAQQTSSPKTLRWSVASSPMGLSTNRKGNVIVACYGAEKLQEYTQAGVIVREISFRNEIKNPLHAVALDRDLFLVSYGVWGGDYSIGVFGVHGKPAGWLLDPARKQIDRLQGSSCLAVARNGSALACEWRQPAVLVMDRSLSKKRDLLMAVDGGLVQPWAVRLDESRGRLYVGEQGGGRVLVFDHVLSEPETTAAQPTATPTRSSAAVATTREPAAEAVFL